MPYLPASLRVELWTCRSILELLSTSLIVILCICVDLGDNSSQTQEDLHENSTMEAYGSQLSRTPNHPPPHEKNMAMCEFICQAPVCLPIGRARESTDIFWMGPSYKLTAFPQQSPRSGTAALLSNPFVAS